MIFNLNESRKFGNFLWLHIYSEILYIKILSVKIKTTWKSHRKKLSPEATLKIQMTILISKLPTKCKYYFKDSISIYEVQLNLAMILKCNFILKGRISKLRGGILTIREIGH